jgi:phosphopantetheinyl transferase (holo-ACP synthase)
MTPGTTAPTSTLSEDVSTIQNCCDRLFDLQLPEGRCVGIQLPEIKDDDPDSLTPQAISDQLDQHWLYKVLHAEEIAYGVEQPACQASRESFFIGRLAMRQALGLHYVSTTDPILKDAHGRPAVPAGFLGSISHKRRTAVALVAVHEQEQQADTGMGDGSRPRLGIGVDIEQTVTSSRNSIARKVLTVRERETLGRIEVSRRGRFGVMHTNDAHIVVSVSHTHASLVSIHHYTILRV